MHALKDVLRTGQQREEKPQVRKPLAERKIGKFVAVET